MRVVPEKENGAPIAKYANKRGENQSVTSRSTSVVFFLTAQASFQRRQIAGEMAAERGVPSRHHRNVYTLASKAGL